MSVKKKLKLKKKTFKDFFIGQSIKMPIKITGMDMKNFAKLSGDYSRIHVDDNFAIKNKFKERIVYGGLITAKLSKLLGMYIPGDLGLSINWSIDFHNPLFINQIAYFDAKIKNISTSTQSLIIEFKLLCNNKLIAKGKTASIILSY